LAKDENGDLLSESHNILNRCKNYFSQLWNVHGVSDGLQMKIHLAELLAREQSPFIVEIAVARLEKI
jgi:hypothetical protein